MQLMDACRDIAEENHRSSRFPENLVTEQCPRCGNSSLFQEKVLNALSRRDNKTYICPSCGTEESVFDFLLRESPLSEEEKEEAIELERAWLEVR